MLQPSLGVSSLDLGRPPGRPLFVCVVGRRRISPEFVEEVAEWLSSAGVTLFFAGSTYAAVKTSVVESWPRITSKRLKLANVTVPPRLQKTRSARLPMLLVRGGRAGVPVHPRSVPTLSGGWADPTAIHDPDSWAS